MKPFRVSLKFLAPIYLCLFAPAAEPSKTANRVERAVPSIFSQYLAPPGKANGIKEPGRIVFDPVSKEIYVADLRNNRILIFDSNNVFRFEFFCSGRINLPLDIAVTQEGFIYALGNSSDGKRIIKFDFDGLHLNTFSLPAILGSNAAEISSMVAGLDGNLYLLDPTNHQIVSLDTNGKFKKRFDISKTYLEKDRVEIVYGSIFLKDSSIYIPLSTFGTISEYSLKGQFLRNIGKQGATVGELSFPSDVSINSDGIIHVVDKERYNVVCFNKAGKFVGEFGGKGFSPGWFYYPNRIATNSKREILVGQVMNNLIQVCKPPPFLNPENAN